MFKNQSEQASKPRVVRLGSREFVTEGLYLSFWGDISHRCMTATWPSFIGRAGLVFVVFNAIFAVFYWIGDQPISSVPTGYDIVAAQTVHARKTYDHAEIRFGHRYAEIPGATEDGRLRVDYGQFHAAVPDQTLV